MSVFLCAGATREGTHPLVPACRPGRYRSSSAGPSVLHAQEQTAVGPTEIEERGEGKRSEPGAMAGGGTVAAVAAAETNEEKEVERTIPG
jgi:hypothetical protein